MAARRHAAQVCASEVLGDRSSKVNAAADEREQGFTPLEDNRSFRVTNHDFHRHYVLAAATARRPEFEPSRGCGDDRRFTGNDLDLGAW